MRLSLDLDTPRLMISAAVGGGAILAHPQMQMAVAVLLAALASVAVDVLKALGRWAVHRLTRDIPKLADTPADPVASGDEDRSAVVLAGSRAAGAARAPSGSAGVRSGAGEVQGNDAGADSKRGGL